MTEYAKVLLHEGRAELCAGCDGVSAWARADEDEAEGVAHIGAASCWEWTCGHCGLSWTPADSPLTAELFAHRPPPPADDDTVSWEDLLS